VLSREHLAYLAAFGGLACGIAAAAIQGGWVPALGAASAGLSGIAAVLGYSAKAPAAPKA